MKDALVTHRRLVAGGLSESQAKAALRLIVEAESGRFDRQSVHEQLEAADLSTPQANVLLADLLQRLARQAGGAS